MTEAISSSSSGAEPLPPLTSSEPKPTSSEPSSEAEKETANPNLSDKEQNAVDKFLASDIAAANPDTAQKVSDDEEGAINFAENSRKIHERTMGNLDDADENAEESQETNNTEQAPPGA